jgi:putative Mg2+ transporter-C (MgtC) family protein
VAILFGMDAIYSDIIRLVIAYLLALPIGWERERAERSAGIRTFPLVAIASCGFILATDAVVAGSAEARARIIEGIIAGMGFIGGGAILKHGDNVRGTATAASLWGTGAIGVSCALQTYDVGVIISAMTLFTLRVLAPFKKDDPET